jgi:hypothetical protein
MNSRPEKDTASFDFKGMTVTGFIISSTDIQPHFHWFLFDDVNLIDTFGDSIAFKVDEGQLKPVSVIVKHQDFIEAVKRCVENHLKLNSK